jgi:exopolysaccharide biosynthesis polyprenyl glycosylphosphotransferase
MALLLATLEGTWMTAVMCWAVMTTRPAGSTWPELLGAAGHALLPPLGWLLGLYYTGLYDFRRTRGYGEFVAGLPRSLAVALALMIPAYVALPERALGGRAWLIGLPIALAVLLLLRASAYPAMRRLAGRERVLVIGTEPLAAEIVDQIESRPDGGGVIVGVADDGVAPDGRPPRLGLLGPLEHLTKVIDQVQPDRIIVALSPRRGRLPVRALLEARTRSIVVEDGVDVYEQLTGKIALESLPAASAIFSRHFPVSRMALAFGRGLSLLVALGGLLLLGPLMLAIAVAVKLDSAGPVLFHQARLGRGGRPFILIKFRTMRPVDAATSEWARDNAARITRVGEWLRKFRLDELPQFVNILRGDMNLIGPRPHPMSNVPLFWERIPYYPLRAVVRPGVTGWAQTRYGYANTLEEETEKMRYDLYYIKHRSVWLDLRILLDTVKVMVLGRDQIAGEVQRLEQQPADRRLQQAA